MASAQTKAVQLGSGIYIRGAAASFDWGVAPVLWWPITGLYSSFLTSTWSEIQLWLQASTVQVPNANFDCFVVGAGLFGVTNLDGANSYRFFQYGQYQNTLTPPYAYGAVQLTLNAQTPNTTAGGANVAANTYDTYVFRMYRGYQTETYRGVYGGGGSWPALSSLGYVGASQLSPGASLLANPTAGALVSGPYISIRTLNAGGRADILLKKMQVLYR
jgi:hypothetical protein